tara:strand:- start:118 stop:273 length:156 start_codon:yes stop_codon:yes gene_type:complete
MTKIIAEHADNLLTREEKGKLEWRQAAFYGSFIYGALFPINYWGMNKWFKA